MTINVLANDSDPAGSGAGVGKDPDNSSLTDLVIFDTPNNDTLNGGSGDDLMTGGSTAYDNNLKALDADLKEWSRTDRTYAQRAADIETGSGYAASFPWSAKTVFSAAVPPDFLNGGTGMDMFYYDPTPIGGISDVVTHFKTGEIKVDIT